MSEPRRLAHLSAEYADRYRQAEIRSPFAHPQFIDAVTRAYALDVETWTTERSTVTTWNRRFGPLRRFTHPAFCYYSPVLCLHGFSATDLTTIAAAAGARRLQLPPEIDVAESKDAQVREFNTYLIAPDALSPASWSASQRRLFVRSRDEYRFREGSSEEVVTRSVDAYRRHDRKPPFNDRRMKRLVSHLASNGIVEAYALDGPSGSCEAALALLVDDRTACYWLAGSKPGPAMTVLLGFVFERLQERELSLDFLGANTPSIAEFKRRFGGQLIRHVHLSIEGVRAFGSWSRIFGGR